MMDLYFLGTASGAPSTERNVSATALIAPTDKAWYLVDCGEATQHQLLRAPLAVLNLRAVFITHLHGDHCYGLPGLLASAAVAGRTEPLALIAPQPVLDWIAATCALTEMFLPYPLEPIAVETLDAWQDERMHVTAHALSHRVPCWGYAFTEKVTEARLDTAALETLGVPRGELWGRLQRGESVEHAGRIITSPEVLLPARAPRRVVIAGDNDDPTRLRAACADAHVLVHEATFLEAVRATRPQWQHASPELVARFAEDVGVPNLVLTHFSPRYRVDESAEMSTAPLRAEAQDHYHGRLFLAQDHLRLRLDTQGALSVPQV